jgi:carboxypeptidase family protein
MRRFVFVGLALLVAGGIVSSMLGHRQSSTADRLAASPSVATLQGAEPAGRQQDVLGVTAQASVTTAAASAAPSTTTGTLRGRLIDAVTRQPVKEFEVKLRRVQHGPVWREEEPLTQTFQSDAGRFSWNNVPPETWRVTVSAHGYLQFDLGEVTIVAGKSTREVVMPLLRGFSLRGRVVAASTGAGIQGAWITFRVVNAWPRGREYSYAKSKEDGSFVLDGVPGGDIELGVGAEGYAGRSVEIVVDENTPPQEFALSVGGRIAGVLRTESGAPIAGTVTMGGLVVVGAEKAASAEFSFDHLGAGRFTIVARTANGTASQEIDLRQNERKEDVVLVVHAGRSIRGTIRGVRPEQLAHTRIMMRSTSIYLIAQPDEQGAYALNGVPPGQAQLAVYADPRQLFKKVEMPADQDLALDFVFPSGARLSGRVTQGGKPATERMVWMALADSKNEFAYRGRTTLDGSYEIEGLPLGEYRVRADEDISRTITIAGDAVLNIDIPSVQLTGRVVEDGSSIPIVHADVYTRGIEAATAQVHGYKATNDFGEFSLTGFEPGEIMLIVYLAGYELYVEKVSYSVPIRNKTISLRKSAGVEVRVHQNGDQEFARGVTVTDTIPGAEREIDLWIPLNREGVGSLPSALAGSKLAIRNNSGKQIVIDEWDGQPLELQL